MSRPLATVLMPVYNAEKYLHEAIDSILNQTYSDFIFLIINDGSTDKSEEIILSYKDPRIRYLKNEQNIRLVATLNKGLDNIDTKYMIRMDADDVSHLQRIEKLINYMEDNTDIGVCGSYIKTFGNDSAIWKYEITDEYIRPCVLYRSLVPHAASIIRMQLLNSNSIRYKEDFIHMEDVLLWSDLFYLTKFSNIPEVLYEYRIISEGVTKRNKDTLFERKKSIYNFIYSRHNFHMSDNIIYSVLKIHLHKKININDIMMYKKWIYTITKHNEINKTFTNASLKHHFMNLKSKLFYKTKNRNIILLFFCIFIFPLSFLRFVLLYK